MGDKPVRITLSVEWPGGSAVETVEYSRAEWNAMSPDERRRLMDEMAADHAGTNGVGFGASCDDPADEPE